ncbi:hypothetical protein WME99_26045 [Sorangium sp. So ce136]|uniref:hypothetical protein n=1 Tax=Sorangium sp. So ce136 TaxID=3133284 RepID=UPI003F054DC4
MSGDPRKMLGSDGGPDVLRAALEAARRDAPDKAQLARLAARLPLRLPDGPGGGKDPGDPADGGGPATGGGAGAPATLAPAGIAAAGAGAPPSVLSGLAVGAALGVVLVGAVWLMPSRSQPPPASLAPTGAAVVATATPRGAAAAPAAEAPEIPAEAPPAAAPRAPAPEPASAPLPARASASTTGAPAAGGSAPAALPDAETELGLLQRAQEALAARPAEALALADAHLGRFPGGALAQEREVIAVGALKALGRGGEALARANRFIAEHPSSAYRRRLEILVPELRGGQR